MVAVSVGLLLTEFRENPRFGLVVLLVIGVACILGAVLVRGIRDFHRKYWYSPPSTSGQQSTQGDTYASGTETEQYVEDDLDPYEILEVDPSASEEEIRQAYRDMVKVWHPDRFSHDQRLQQKANQKIKEINNAYEQIRSS